MSLFAKLNQTVTKQPKIKQTLENSFRYYDEMPDFIQSYVLSRLSLHYSKRTIQRYLYDFKYFFDYVFSFAKEDVSMRDIKRHDFLELDRSGIEAYVQFLTLEVGNAPSTINRKISALQSLFQFLMQQGYTNHNPIDGIERPKEKKKDPVYLTHEESQQFLDGISQMIGITKKAAPFYKRLQKRDYAIIYWLMKTGLRISELQSLTMKQLSFTSEEISVIGKGNKQRTIPIAESTFTVLHEYIQSLPSDVRPTKGDDFVFIGYNPATKKFTKNMTIRSIQLMIERHIERLKPTLPFLHYKTITPHKLRHSFATELIHYGVDVLTIQSLLGHESVATTQIYAHIQKDAKKKAIQQLDH
ncbi:tyrosine-type recombinase/integrase [Massilibacterium senegalense]|uniref:tyrosine-type recombinase/integrase n=1 Tax=Massilibacterium senegalense TaxID=1632858 RepID=UPI000784B673|nr:tyrosine-type recombinase/integrase [Massilibacterium senegalense]